MRTRTLRFLSVICFSLALQQLSEGQQEQKALLPGRLSNGDVLLPNGWKLSPAGTQIPLGDLPLGFDLSPNGQFAAVTNNGVSRPTISIVDLNAKRVTQTIPVKNAWLGVKFAHDGKSFFVSGGNENAVYWYRLMGDTAELGDTIRFSRPYPKANMSVAGLDIDTNDSLLYVACRGDSSLRIVNLKKLEEATKKKPLDASPYTCLASRDGQRVYISLWDRNQVAVYNIQSLSIEIHVDVGGHPNDMALSSDGQRLFVANANGNTVSIVDVKKWKVTETIRTSLTPDAPLGSTPNSVVATTDGKTLLVANADNNCLAVFDISHPGKTKARGFIPVGWYPTGVRVNPISKKILVLNGKGLTSLPNPKGPNPTLRHPPKDEQYIGRLLVGSLSVIDLPSARELADYSKKVYENCPYVRSASRKNPCPSPNPIPRKRGQASPIKHVFYVIKENRTYDQVFGDIPEGNGDSTLCLFPERITPNHHALAKQFVLLDNFYHDAEVSADGHNWVTAAYATDYVEKTWPTNYGGRGGEYDFQGENELSRPSSGYLWDLCRKRNVTYRDYGEFAVNGKTETDSVKPEVDGLIGHIAPFFRSWDLDYSDVNRVKEWMKEFDEAEREGKLEALQIIWLPNDHTSGTRKGSLTPQAHLGQNDYALGLLVERISRSKFWKESAIFVVEDDAQNGPDHVDAHRTVALVISPYARHHFVDHTMYSTSSMLRTIELILGLPSMTQFDAAATPMCNSFTSSYDLGSYTALPPKVDLDEKNVASAYGSDRSGELNFAEEDATPDIEFNEIIWKAIRGSTSEMPAPVRSAFVRVAE
ncbi:MAG: bifunctional YncE family protein/alkaline phosphatase family protein [Bacteroidota bacterium]